MLKEAINIHAQYCLHCGNLRSDVRYLCDCTGEPWQREYRNLDIRFPQSEVMLREIRKSYNTFDLNHPRGILQYAALPYQGAAKKPMSVGLTPLLPLDHLSKVMGVQIHIKCEGHNPSGCFKDRETLMCLLHSRHQGLRKSTIFSSGNAAASAALFAQKHRFRLIAFVPGDTYGEKIDYITSHGADVIVIGDRDCNFETGYRLYSQAHASGEFIRNDFDNWSVINPYRIQGDKTIAVEIVKQLSKGARHPKVPDFVIVPTANGSCLAGIWKGFVELYNASVISTLPRMVSAGIQYASPVKKAVREHLLEFPTKRNIDRVDPGDADIGSIILAAEGYDSIEAANAVIISGGNAVELTREDIEASFQMLVEKETALARDEDIMPEPASMISIAAIEKLSESGKLRQGHTIVSILTGSGVKARRKVQELTPGDRETVELVNEILDRKLEGQYPEAHQKGSIKRSGTAAGDLVGAFREMIK